MKIRHLLGALCVVAALCAAASIAQADEMAQPTAAPTFTAEQGAATQPASYARTPRWQSRRNWKRFAVRAELGMGCIKCPEGTLGETLPAGLTPFEWDEIDCAKALAGRLTLGYRWAPCDEVELRGSWYGQRDGDDRQTGQFAFTNNPGISPVATATLESEASLWGAELGWWRRLGGSRCLSWRAGLGVRYIRFDETASAGDWVGLAPSSFLESDVDNNLFAGQIMGAVTWSPGRWAFQLSGRLFGGSLNSEVEVLDDSILSGGRKQATDEETEFGWGGEIGLDIRYRLSGCVSLTLGYSFLYLGEIQRATDAMDFSAAATGAVQARSKTDDVFAQMLVLGVQIDI